MSICWTEDRKALSDLLDAKDAVLGDLYRHSVDTLEPEPITRAALMVASHCIREIIAGLPAVLELAPFKQTDIGKQARRLGDAWRSAGYPLSEINTDVEADTSSHTGSFSVSAAVFLCARDVAIAASAISLTARRKTAMIVAGQPEAAEIPAVRRFHQALDDGFMTWVHFQNYGHPASALPDQQVVERELVIIEQGLLSRLANFADRAELLRATLERANTQSENPT